MIPGLMHVLNELKERQAHLAEFPDKSDTADVTSCVLGTMASIQDWVQDEIDKEIDGLAEHHSQRELAEEG